MDALYIMLSSTPCAMGAMIRTVTGFPFNHVSLTMDDTLRSFCSFARLNQHAPLAGGFVTETAERYAAVGDTLPIRLFRISLSPPQAARIRAILDSARANRHLLTYNSLGAAASALHLRCPLPGAYTCLEFANVVLKTDFNSIRGLSEYLQPWLQFSGDLFSLVTPGVPEPDVFFEDWTTAKICRVTASHFLHLAQRAISPKKFPDPIRAADREVLFL